MAHHLTTCTFCGAGCGLYLETSGGRVAGAYPSMSHPSNAGRICVRGWHVHEIASSPARLRRPLLRRDGALREVSWDEALGFVVDRLREIRGRFGPEAIAFLGSPRCSNEESYLLQKLARAVIGTPHVDHGARVYGHNSIDVLMETLGVPASTGSIADLDGSDVIVVDGVDLARELPTIAGRVIRARLRGARLIVIGERRHRVAEQADIFLQIRPGTEALLYGAMAKVIVDRGLIDRAFLEARCRQYEPYLGMARQLDLVAAAERCGVAARLVEEAALAYARAAAAAVLYSTATEGRDRDSVGAMVNLVLLTGQVGRAGAGLYPLAEHNNLQGVCDMGLLPDRLPGYRPVASSAARAELERRWGTPLPPRPGLAASAVLSDRGFGTVRAVWLCRYDPVSTGMVGDSPAALEACDLVVVQHIFATETARLAHVVLPTSAFGEEQVTFTSTERRIQLANRAIDPPPGVTPAWLQLAQVARGLGANWRYGSSSEVMDEITEVVPFYGAAQHENLARDYGRQWPCPRDRPLGTPLLFAVPGEAAPFRFAPVDPRPRDVETDANHLLMLVFGHSNYYWNQNVLIQQSEALRREYRTLLLDYPGGFVELHPDDAEALGVEDGERIRLTSSAGTAVTAARVTAEVRRGAVFVPFFVSELEHQIRGGGRAAAARVAVRVEREAP